MIWGVVEAFVIVGGIGLILYVLGMTAVRAIQTGTKTGYSSYRNYDVAKVIPVVVKGCLVALLVLAVTISGGMLAGNAYGNRDNRAPDTKIQNDTNLSGTIRVTP